MPNLEGGKKHWYTRVFEIPWPKLAEAGPVLANEGALPVHDDDGKASLVIDDIGSVSDKTVHLTVFRDTWRFRFRRDLPTDVIFDRIFGSGTGGIHVTLELEADKGLHCYLKGANEGRTAVEKKALDDLLQQYVSSFKAKIDTAKKNHAAFVWKDCDDPAKRFEYLFTDVKTDVFGRIAQMAGDVCKAHVVYPTQSDAALMFAGNAVHPLQLLQNTHQRQIRDACRGLGQDDAREGESQGMTRFFHFQANPPRPLGPPDPERKTLDERMEDIESTLSTIGRFLEVADPDVVHRTLTKVRDELKSVRGAFFYVAPQPGEGAEALRARKAAHANRVMAVPGLAEMDKKMGRAHKALEEQPHSRALCETAHAQLTKAHRDLDDALAGLCSVQNFHSIEPFYLFRLMVKFDLRSTTAIPAGLRPKISGAATGFVHNSREVAWLFAWLRDRLVELDRRLAKALPVGAPTEAWPQGEPKYCFYLKGGRAAKYAQGRGPDGENDWDTNIVINPNLRAGDWYETFATVHNEVLQFLSDAKRSFTIEVHDPLHAAKLLAALDEHQAGLEKAAEEKRAREQAERDLQKPSLVWSAVATVGWAFSSMLNGLSSLVWSTNQQDTLARDRDDNVDRIADRQVDLARKPGIELEEGEREGCKAELIDIGIPRRDTIEAFAQWQHVCPHVKKCPDGIPIPDQTYFVAEYALMIREAFAERCISVGKTPKRVMRLLEVLELDELDELVYPEWDRCMSIFSLRVTAKKVGALDEPRKRMVAFLVVQLFHAYDLRIDAGLTSCFDKLAGSALDVPHTKATYPGSLTKAIKDYEEEEAKKPKEKQVPYAPQHRELADSIGYIQWVAQRMDAHFRKERAPFMLEHRTDLENFVRAIYTGSVFATHEELQVKMAITGAYAARLHAEYGRLEAERFDELEPIRRLDLTVYARDGAKPEIALELVEPLVKQYIDAGSGGGNIKFVALAVNGDTLCLTLPTEQAFSSEFTYKPLVIMIRAVSCEENWPSVSFIRGLPVLNLRDLIWEYKRRAGEIEEAYTQEGLRVAVEALADLLTRFENPNPGALPVVPKPQPQVAQPQVAQPQPPPPQGPAPVQPPLERSVVDGVDGVGQIQSNWCWAATSLMMRKFYLGDRASLQDVVREAFDPPRNEKNALRLSRLRPRGGVERRTLSWADVKQRINRDEPFIIGNAGHYFVCRGYEEQGSRKTLLVWDPMGQGAARTIAYADYERGTREQDWSTATDFEIAPRRELASLSLQTPAVDFNQQDARIGLSMAPPAPATTIAARLRVREEKNVLGDVGAVLGEKKIVGVPSDVACCETAAMLLAGCGSGRYLVELELELPDDAAYQPNQSVRVTVAVTQRQ